MFTAVNPPLYQHYQGTVYEASFVGDFVSLKALLGSESLQISKEEFFGRAPVPCRPVRRYCKLDPVL